LIGRNSDSESRELLAAMSRHQHIVLLAKRAKYVGGLNQYAVAEFMAKLIVNRLEVIKVAHQGGDGHLCLAGVRQHRGRRFFESAPIEQSRKLIGASNMPQLGPRQVHLPHRHSRAV
jgi:hypothetical protein